MKYTALVRRLRRAQDLGVPRVDVVAICDVYVDARRRIIDDPLKLFRQPSAHDELSPPTGSADEMQAAAARRLPRGSAAAQRRDGFVKYLRRRGSECGYPRYATEQSNGAGAELQRGSGSWHALVRLSPSLLRRRSEQYSRTLSLSPSLALAVSYLRCRA